MEQVEFSGDRTLTLLLSSSAQRLAGYRYNRPKQHNDFEEVKRETVAELPHRGHKLQPDALSEEIHCTLVHGIAHYYGMDDDHVEELGWGC